MKIVGINMVAESSTGTIMRGIAQCAREKGHEVLTFSCPSFSLSHPEKFIPYEGHRYFGTRFGHALHFLLARENGKNGRYSAPATRKLIREIKKFGPDLIHLHNLHNFCINLPLFFRFLKESGVPVVLTLHDCWTFTGHCPYFDMVGCEKWKEHCHDCPQLSVYPESKKDRSAKEFEDKKTWFGTLPNLTLVTPSFWMRETVQESFLKKFPAEVIKNGIDLATFTPTESDFRKKHSLDDKFILLGVSFGWSERKGLDVFIELSKRLGEEFQIVLVGADPGEIDLPKKILSISRTGSAKELAGIYSAADLFVNPTREEMFGLVNAEALACGTPVLTFRTGGSPEILDDKSGCVVEKNDIDALEKEIRRIAKERPFAKDDCIQRAKAFDKNDRFKEYVTLYENIFNKK